MSQVVPVEPQQPYTLAVEDASADIPGGSGLEMEVADAASGSVLARTTGFAAGRQQSRACFTTPQNVHFLTLMLDYQRQPGTVPLEGRIAICKISLLPGTAAITRSPAFRAHTHLPRFPQIQNLSDNPGCPAYKKHTSRTPHAAIRPTGKESDVPGRHPGRHTRRKAHSAAEALPTNGEFVRYRSAVAGLSRIICSPRRKCSWEGFVCCPYRPRTAPSRTDRFRILVLLFAAFGLPSLFCITLAGAQQVNRSRSGGRGQPHLRQPSLPTHRSQRPARPVGLRLARAFANRASRSRRFNTAAHATGSRSRSRV